MPYRYNPNATNGAHEIFETPTPDPQDWYRDSAGSSPRSAMSTTTVEQLEQKARLQNKDRQETPNRLFELGPIEDMSSAVDGQPRVMDFYNGRSYSEGRALHNQSRIARGLAPIPEGKR
jgi:hypothetical protein